MEVQTQKWPRVPSGEATLSKGRSMSSCQSRGAKNPWEYSNCRKKNKNIDKGTKLYIGTYNARTLNTEGSMEELHQELDKINWHILGLSEVRRPGEECLKLKAGHTLYYRGRDNGKKEHGVGILIHKSLEEQIVSTGSTSERVVYVIMSLSKKITIKLVQVYAPTSTAPDAEIHTLYEDIEKAFQIRKTTYTFLIGDFNAKVGKREELSETFMGRFGFGDRNPRGRVLVSFLQCHKLYHLSSYYEKRPERKWTWLSPGGRHKNEIDYIFSSHRYIVQDVSVLNKFNTRSDHRLVRATLYINAKLARYTSLKKANSSKIDTVSLKINAEQYRALLEKSIPDKPLEALTIDELNSHLSKTMINAATEIAKRKPNSHNKLSEETKALLQKRREMVRNSNKYKDLCKLVRSKVEKDIREYKERKVRAIIERHRGPKVFRKQLEPGCQVIAKLKNKDGNLIVDRLQVLKVIEHYYSNLYAQKTNEPDHTNRLTIRNVGSEDIPEITKEEVMFALSKLKNGKASGEDGILPEMLKEGGEKLLDALIVLFNRCLHSGDLPEGWNSAVVIILYKKGCKTDLNNYRPISLLSQTYKLFSKIITTRITPKLDFYQPIEQAGFRAGYSTIEHILAMRVLIEKTTEYQMPLWLAFIDYKKAFDSVETWAVHNSLRNARVDHRYNQLIARVYQNAKMKVSIPQMTNPINIKRGVRQGDNLSPKLFTLVVEDVFKKLNWQKRGISISGARLTNLRFADDIVLFADNPTELQEMIEDLHNTSLRVGLEMNLDKTKVMTSEQQNNIRIEVGGTEIEQVQKYVYLGQEIKIGKENQCNEIDRRIRLGWAAYSKLEYVFNMNLTSRQKAQIFDQCILPVLTYGAETWVTTQEVIHKLGVAQRHMERKIVGVCLKDRVTNKDLRRRSKVTDVGRRVAKLKWEWAGHIARKSESWCKRLLDWRPWDQKRPRGRPQMRWKDDIKQVAGSNWTLTAQNREEWKEMKEAYIRMLIEEG
nr:unnamed protein product [Amyelois transitella]